MVIIQPGCCYSGNEKLAAVGISSSIRHADKQRSAVLHLKGLIIKIFAVNTDGASAVAVFNVAPYNIVIINNDDLYVAFKKFFL